MSQKMPDLGRMSSGSLPTENAGVTISAQREDATRRLIHESSRHTLAVMGNFSRLSVSRMWWPDAVP